jgi:uncharacterized protein YbbC (DUF1343 family)
MNSRFILVVVCLWFVAFQNDSCTANTLNNKDAEETIRTGAERTEDYFPLLENLRIAVAGNHTSMLGATHLVDTLLRAGFNRGKSLQPGTWVSEVMLQPANGSTALLIKQTGLPIVSLYGSNRRPTPSHLNDIDLIVFDIQDVGVRFYTYISTMTYIMEEAARQGHLLLSFLTVPTH